jgi:hypothetical protein
LEVCPKRNKIRGQKDGEWNDEKEGSPNLAKSFDD